MKQTRVQEQRFLPWTHEAHGLELALLGGRLDAQALELVDARNHAVDLSGPWQRAELELELRVAAQVVERVLPEHERGDPPLAVVVALRCDRTHLRRRVCLRGWAEGASERFGARVELARDELAELAQLDAWLIRTRALERAGHGVALPAGARLASARPWLLRVDEPAQHRGNYLDVQYRSFARDPAIPLGERAALYRLDLDREDPILYLNADHERLRPVLDSKATTGRRARLRELLYERVEAGVWTQLVLRASARFVEDGELAYAWEQTVLARWLPRLYPDQVDDEARRERLRGDYQRLPSLLAQLDATIQTTGELALVATKLVDEL